MTNKVFMDLKQPFQPKKHQAIFFLLIFLCAIRIFGQQTAVDSLQTSSRMQFNVKTLIVPTVLIGYGIIGLENDQLKILDSEISEEVTENIDGQVTMDDFSQYLPAVSVYGLNAFG